jgi:putative membrane protein
MMWFNGMGAGGWLLMGLLMLLFWAVVIVGVVWLVRGRGTSPGADPDLAARRTLDERLARGEIDVDRYRQGLDLLAHR